MKLTSSVYRCIWMVSIAAMMPGVIRQQASAQNSATLHPYQDLTHESAVFGHKKFFRLYLPRDYEHSADRFPVIYFFHGWGGRHYMDDNAKLEYDKLKELVDAYRVILVMWDGNIEESEPRPYNVGWHQDIKYQVQMADYFPELTAHIDAHYRTLADRNHRGIIGFSMGGFMSFFLAGKYPDSVAAAVSLAGSPEFYVGFPDMHTLYPVRYTFENLKGVHLRMHNGDSDILFFLNQEVHQGAEWAGIPIDYWQFHGPHMVDYPGETKVFESAVKFVVEAFHEKNPLPTRWTHADLYPRFSAWGYRVESDKNETGFITLSCVDASGFGVSTLRWLPDGPPLKSVSGTVTTPPIYIPNVPYRVKEVRLGRTAVREVVSDQRGRLTFPFDQEASQIGISRRGDPPSYVFLDYRIGEHGRFLRYGSKNALSIRVFNRGGEPPLPQTLRVEVRSNDSAVVITDGLLAVNASPGQSIINVPPLNVSCTKMPPAHAEPPEVRMTISVRAESREFTDQLIVPIQFEVPSFDSVRVDDGVAIREKAFGTGNADGFVDHGERVMLYKGEHRLRLYTEDPWIVRNDEVLADEIIPARWPDGYTLSSIVHVDPNCPSGHLVDCLASYETKSFNPIERKVTWGRVHFVVGRP